MIKSYQPVSLNLIRNFFLDEGLYIARIRTIRKATLEVNEATLDIFIDPKFNDADSSKSPSEMYFWAAGNLPKSIFIDHVEYRSKQWVLRIVTSAGDDPESELWNYGLWASTLGNSTASDALGGSGENEMLDNSPLIW